MSDDKNLKLEDGRDLSYKSLTGKMRCEFCGLDFEAVEFDGDQKGYGILHTAPECPEFIAMDVVTFLRENRVKKQIAQAGKNGLPN